MEFLEKTPSETSSGQVITNVVRSGYSAGIDGMDVVDSMNYIYKLKEESYVLEYYNKTCLNLNIH